MSSSINPLKKSFYMVSEIASGHSSLERFIFLLDSLQLQITHNEIAVSYLNHKSVQVFPFQQCESDKMLISACFIMPLSYSQPFPIKTD